MTLVAREDGRSGELQHDRHGMTTLDAECTPAREEEVC